MIKDLRTVLLTGPCTNDPFLSVCRRRRSVALVEIESDQGVTGIGETYVGYFLPEAVPAIVDFFKPILLGQTVDNIEELWQRMYRCGNFWCRVGLGLNVINGIEAALWDLKGKQEGKPVYELIGGLKHDRLPCYATGGPSNYPLDRLFAKVEHYMSHGFNGCKLGVGAFDERTGQFDLATDPSKAADFEAEKLQKLREHFGPNLRIMLDGHMGNSPSGTWDVETALKVMNTVEPYDLFFFEEPLHYTDPSGYAELCKQTDVPIAGGECLTGLAEWQTFLERDCFDIGQPDASFTGGMSIVMKVAAMLNERGRTMATHAWGAGPSLMQNVHCAFAAANTCIIEVPPDYGPLHVELMGDSFRMEDGFVLPPDEPGLGVRLTDEIKGRFPFEPGSGEFNSVPGKIMEEESQSQ